MTDLNTPPGDPLSTDSLPGSEGQEPALDPRITESLKELLGAPPDVRRRAAQSVDRRLQGRSLLSLAGDVCGVGWATLQLLLTNGEESTDWEEDHD